jgi:acyl-CoA hydrolase
LTGAQRRLASSILRLASRQRRSRAAAVAHPQFREELEKTARELKYL